MSLKRKASLGRRKSASGPSAEFQAHPKRLGARPTYRTPAALKPHTPVRGGAEDGGAADGADGSDSDDGEEGDGLGEEAEDVVLPIPGVPLSRGGRRRSPRTPSARRVLDDGDEVGGAGQSIPLSATSKRPGRFSAFMSSLSGSPRGSLKQKDSSGSGGGGGSRRRRASSGRSNGSGQDGLPALQILAWDDGANGDSDGDGGSGGDTGPKAGAAGATTAAGAGRPRTSGAPQKILVASSEADPGPAPAPSDVSSSSTAAGTATAAATGTGGPASTPKQWQQQPQEEGGRRRARRASARSKLMDPVTPPVTPPVHAHAGGGSGRHLIRMKTNQMVPPEEFEVADTAGAVGGGGASSSLQKRRLRIGTVRFNRAPEDGLMYLFANGCLLDEPGAILAFLLGTPGVSRQTLGEFLGAAGERSLVMLMAYLAHLELAGDAMDVALRKFFRHCRLPRDQTRSEHVVSQLAGYFCQCNPDAFEDKAGAATLALAVILLNGNLHGTADRARRRAARTQFLGHAARCGVGRDAMAEIYARLEARPLVSDPDHTDTVLYLEQHMQLPPGTSLVRPDRYLVRQADVVQIARPGQPTPPRRKRRALVLFSDLLVLMKRSGDVRVFHSSVPLRSIRGVRAASYEHHPDAVEVLGEDGAVLLRLAASGPLEQGMIVAEVEQLRALLRECDAPLSLLLGGGGETGLFPSPDGMSTDAVEQELRVLLDRVADLQASLALRQGPQSTAWGADLFTAAAAGNLDALRRQLAAAGAGAVDAVDAAGMTALQLCTFHNHTDCARALLAAGAGVNLRAVEGATALHYAALHGSQTMMALLLEHGAEAGTRDDLGRTPLHWSTSNISTECLAFLVLRFGADVNAPGADEMTPLMYASWANRPFHAKALLSLGADVDEKDGQGRTAVHWAVHEGDVETLTALLTLQSSFYRDCNGRSVMHYAAEKGAIEAVNLVLAVRPDSVHDEDKSGRTALFWAAAHGQTTLLRQLAGAGADLAHKDRVGKTAIQYARELGQTDVVALLEPHCAAGAQRAVRKG